MKTLVVFDFDDTLFESGAMIGVKKSGSEKRYLSSHEYASYTPSEDEEFDYEQFQSYPPNPQPIDNSTQKFHSSVGNHGINNVIILTARDNATPVREVLENFGMPPVKIITIGSSNPEHKADVVENLVNEKKYDRVVVYEDSSANIAAIRKRLKPAMINFIAFKVTANPRGGRLQKEMKLK